MKFIVKRNIYTNEIVDCWDKLKTCAEEIGVKPPTIKQAIRTGGKCHDYFFGYIDIDKKKILELIKDDDGNRLR